MPGCTLAIDIGTSSTKTGLCAPDGRLLASASADYAGALVRAAPTWAEIDPRAWWNAVVTTVRAVLAESRISPRDVGGVGVDGLGWALVAVDRAGEPLAPAPIWLDRRAEDEAAWLRAHPHAAAWADLAANPLDAAYITPKLLWMKAHQPGVFADAHCFLTCTGYITHRLTGAFTCDYTQAYGFHLFDMRRERWDETAADQLGIPLEKMPPLSAPTAVVGTITGAAAEATGLHAGTPVIAGCLDAAAGAFGSGVARPGQCADQGGTAFGFSLCTAEVVFEPRLIFSHHVVPGAYLLQGGTVGGGLLGWWRDTLGAPERVAAELLGENVFRMMTEHAARSPVGASGLVFLPYMAGERSPVWNSDARGVFFGLSFTSTRADMLRAIMEGAAFAVYHNVQVARERGAHISGWVGIGGAAESALWSQIKADISDRPFTVARRADGTPGDNLLGLDVMIRFGLGEIADMPDAIDARLPLHTTCTPDPAAHARYAELFAIYLSLSEKLAPEFAALAKGMR